MSLQDVKAPNFPEMEEEIVKYWKDIDAFKTSLEMSKDKKPYSFYDGPPFATGLPHYGHILAGTMKDIVTRYAHQTGHFVERRFGWDCHGLPIEFEIEKDLGIKTKDEVLKYGIGNYNEKCRDIVMRYAGEWKSIITRLGRWIDFDNDYKTMNISYMESVWWVFSQLFEKGLVYRGYKIMPYSTACTTPLSNFEANLNYKMATDPAIIVSFPLVDQPDVSFIAWTTTPWTLPSNLALCVNPTLDYVKIQDAKGNKYILMKARMSVLAEKNQKDFTILEEFKGETLKGLKYVPLFDYFASRSGSFRVVTGSFVTEDAGTGIVHCAPAFGEEDFKVCLESGVIEKGESIPCPIDENGRFTDQVPDLTGKYIKDCDEIIMTNLKNMKRLVKKGTLIHSYPFCWRSDTPLIYRIVPSWFVSVEKIKENLVKNNKGTYWVPDTIKEKRFHNWLTDARDWAISRSRYWGTPLPIWRSDDWEEIVCVGSVAELEELTGTKVTDLHRHNIDHLTIPSKKGKGNLKRIEEVFDCWFESGSMPYAQCHYPFENKEKFEKTFPADFIAEGLDQTRGWFYTLLVLGTALFDKAPWKNLIVNGLVLALDGKKMSKRLKNYPDPLDVVHVHGADALRLYLINSPVVRAEDLNFDQEGVKEVVRSVLIPWYNTYKFFVEVAKRYQDEFGSLGDLTKMTPTNVMSKWITSTSQSLIKFVHQEMQAYRLDTVVPKVLIFIDQTSRWYIRLNRKRLKGGAGKEAWLEDLATLFNVLLLSVQAMAPFTPFITEVMYSNLKCLLPNAEKSLHFTMLPQYDETKVDLKIEKAVERMQSVIEAGRTLREVKKIELTMPVSEYLIIDNDADFLGDILSLQDYIKDELNTKSVLVSEKLADYFKVSAGVNYKNLGQKLKLSGNSKKTAPIEKALGALNHTQIMNIINIGSISLEGEDLSLSDIVIKREFIGNSEKYESIPDSMVLMNYIIDDALEGEGVCRTISSLVQTLRKEAKLVVSDKINVHFVFPDENDKVCQYMKANQDFLNGLLKDTGIFYTAPASGDVILLTESPDSKVKKEKEMKEKKEKEKLEREKKESEKKQREEDKKKEDEKKKDEKKKDHGKTDVKVETKSEKPKTEEKKPSKLQEKKKDDEKKKKRVDIVDSQLTIHLIKQTK